MRPFLRLEVALACSGAPHFVCVRTQPCLHEESASPSLDASSMRRLSRTPACNPAGRAFGRKTLRTSQNNASCRRMPYRSPASSKQMKSSSWRLGMCARCTKGKGDSPALAHQVPKGSAGCYEAFPWLRNKAAPNARSTYPNEPWQRDESFWSNWALALRDTSCSVSGELQTAAQDPFGRTSARGMRCTWSLRDCQNLASSSDLIAAAMATTELRIKRRQTPQTHLLAEELPSWHELAPCGSTRTRRPSTQL